MELKLHARRFKYVNLKRFEDRPILRAHIKRDEVLSPAVSRATTNRDGCMCGNPRWGEVVSAGPVGEGLPKTKDLVYLRLLE